MSCEIAQLQELQEAINDSKVASNALFELRQEFASLGCQVEVDWRSIVAAQRNVELSFMAAYAEILTELCQ